MGNPDRVKVWELRLELAATVTNTELQDLERAVKDREAREPILPFVWRFEGAALTVRTQGDVFLLHEITEWALMHLSHGPTRSTLENKNTAPVAVREGWGWSGHGRA